MSEYYGDQYDELDYGPGLSSELARALSTEFHHNRVARDVVMTHTDTGVEKIGALWWRGGPGDAVITATLDRHRLTYSVADWVRFGWHIDGVPAA